MLAPWKKSYDQTRQHINKQRRYFVKKVWLVKIMVFPVVMYRCESWTTKKAEQQGIDAFEFWCWRRLLRVPWTARRSNKSILKAISPEYSLEELMLKLKLQYFGHLMWRADSFEKTMRHIWGCSAFCSIWKHLSLHGAPWVDGCFAKHQHSTNTIAAGIPVFMLEKCP